MGKETTPRGDQEDMHATPVSGVVINLEERSVTLLSQREVLATVRLSPTGLIFEGHSNPEPLTPIEPHATPDTEPSPSTPVEQISTPEKGRTVTLAGKLKSKPRSGRPDSKGNPTAWARFAAHEEESENAHIYSATFHKHTAPIALGLDTDASLVVQGYPHEYDDPEKKRMDTLSVINLVDYPGKQKS
jgi:hypothetical protein